MSILPHFLSILTVHLTWPDSSNMVHALLEFSQTETSIE